MKRCGPPHGPHIMAPDQEQDSARSRSAPSDQRILSCRIDSAAGARVRVWGLPQNLWVERRAGSPRQTHSVPVCSPPSRRVAPLRPRSARPPLRGADGLDAGCAHERPGSCLTRTHSRRPEARRRGAGAGAQAQPLAPAQASGEAHRRAAGPACGAGASQPAHGSRLPAQGGLSIAVGLRVAVLGRPVPRPLVHPDDALAARPDEGGCPHGCARTAT